MVGPNLWLTSEINSVGTRIKINHLNSVYCGVFLHAFPKIRVADASGKCRHNHYVGLARDRFLRFGHLGWNGSRHRLRPRNHPLGFRLVN